MQFTMKYHLKVGILDAYIVCLTEKFSQKRSEETVLSGITKFTKKYHQKVLAPDQISPPLLADFYPSA